MISHIRAHALLHPSFPKTVANLKNAVDFMPILLLTAVIKTDDI